MHLTATHINYYHICHRKLWLFANGINMEHSSDAVADGKLLHETSYPQRAARYAEIELSFPLGEGWQMGGKIDFYDAGNKVIHELKRSDKMEEAHEWQVKFYILLLALNGITGATGLLEYPKLRETKTLELTETDTARLYLAMEQIREIVAADICPPLLHAKICKSCSYFDFCYAGE